MIPDPNSKFQQYILSPEETVQGFILSPVQRALLQNELVRIMEQKQALSPTALTPEGKETYWQHEAYYRGQFDLLTWLFEASDNVLAEQAQLTQE